MGKRLASLYSSGSLGASPQPLEFHHKGLPADTPLPESGDVFIDHPVFYNDEGFRHAFGICALAAGAVLLQDEATWHPSHYVAMDWMAGVIPIPAKNLAQLVKIRDRWHADHKGRS